MTAARPGVRRLPAGTGGGPTGDPAVEAQEAAVNAVSTETAVVDRPAVV